MRTLENAKIELTVLLVAAAMVLAGCAPSDEISRASSDRILFHDQPLVIEYPNSGSSVSTMAAPTALSLTLAFDFLPPAPSNTGNVQTYASDIMISGNYAYTAYNTVGTPQAGATDIIHLGILGLLLPSIQSTKYFTDFDVNRVVYDSSTSSVLLLGAKENVGAHFKKLPISGTTLQAPSLQVDLDGYAGTGIAPGTGGIFVTTGDNSGVKILNATTGAPGTSISMNDARDVKTLSNGDRLVLTGGSCLAATSTTGHCDTAAGTKTPPKIERYNSAGTLVWTTPLTGASIAESKSTIAVGSTYAAATLGNGGLSVICLADGKVMTTIPQVTVSGLASPLTVTNAVTAVPGMLVTADGQGGVSIYQIESSTTGPTSSCAKMKLTSVGRTNFGDGSSANNISSGSFSLTIGLLGIKIYAGRLYIAAGTKGIRTVDLNFTLTSSTNVLDL